jgi:hypothetical protein
MQEQTDVGASFTTTRTRATVVAVITTLVGLALVPHDLSYSQETLKIELFLHIVCLVCLVVAVRSWRVVFRPLAELRLTPTTLTVRRGARELSVPWNAVGQIRIDGDASRPWVVAWLDPLQSPADVPASRRNDGAYKLFPVAHGRSVKHRWRELKDVRAAITGYGRRYLDATF